MNKFSMSIPGSSGNLGPGFDSCGMAVNLYLTLHVEVQERWEFFHESPYLPPVENDADHLIFQTAKQTAERHQKQLPSCKVVVESDIPLARGLGSSASAVLAGIEMANQLCEIGLTDEQKLQYGTELEGHPDNIAPALYGGIVFSAVTEERIEHIQVSTPELGLVVHIPDTELKTEKARQLVPESFLRNYASSASAVSNVMVAALLVSDYRLAGRMMEQDLFHEPYRAGVVPNYELIRNEAKKAGAFGSIISGAGPSMISFVPEAEGKLVRDHMRRKLPDYKIAVLEIDMTGLQVGK
ncbi:homoserine kinase [Virgibacillus siamensis]|uniref:homoserine kinase n=1 Tax=Virgibacillus siamensis TaxID=480071 RepID=UPI000984E10D|nr:homoserine kinase [Virgibacillus siamensis]